MQFNPEDFRIEEMPGGEDQNFGWSIRRAPADRPLKLVCLSDAFLGVRTHYYRGRTQPCAKVDCAACAAHMLSRWTGYLAAVDQADNAAVIFEFTPPGAIVLAEARKEFNTLRGLQIVAGRSNARANGKVNLSHRGISSKAHKLAEAPILFEVMSHIWGLRTQYPAKFVEFEEGSLSEHEKVLLRNRAFDMDTYLAEDAKPLKEGKPVSKNRINGHVKPLENQKPLFNQ